MGRLADIFTACRARGDRALMPYLTAGDPDLATTAALLPAITAAGADIIEIGVPFSDPLLDGPVIQASANRALAAGTTPTAVMDLIAAVRPEVAAGLIYMVPTNLVQRHGLQRFAEDCARVGVDGVLITDLPPEEAGPWQAAADAAGVETVYIVAPTSSPQRIALAAERCTGFLYCISRRGVTGVQAALPPELGEVLARIRAVTSRPVAIGFGISTAAHVRAVGQIADGAIVGSALVQAVADAPPERRVAVAAEFVAGLRA
ncbi:MAG: tryptophan synthase subunit alpha [Fimbriimonadaceae bacterium]|nr:tryptophan synthase subunit alpha [Fimbriimonadaceae bacterium]